MNEVDPRVLLLALFGRLRASGFVLGVGELLAALYAVEAGWGASGPDELGEVVRLLWSHGPIDDLDIKAEWGIVCRGETPTNQVPPPYGLPRNGDVRNRPPDLPTTEPPLPAPPSNDRVVAPLPIRLQFTPAPADDRSDLTTYWPVARRSMLYAWRYLRRPATDGPRDVLDVNATVQQAARRGFFLEPSYRQRERNRAHLLLMVDQGGSMTPFHRFTGDMVETAEQESSLGLVEVVYFRNVPATSVYTDVYLTAQVSFEEVFAGCSDDTSILILSDAGAARGHLSVDRILAATRFLARMRDLTTLVAWLNPMPRGRWANTTAQVIANLVPMFQMDPDGLSAAIDVARGQPIHHFA